MPSGTASGTPAVTRCGAALYATILLGAVASQSSWTSATFVRYAAIQRTSTTRTFE